MSDEKTRVSIVGLGKLGVPMAVAFSAKGHGVIGVDTYQPVVDAVNRGLSPLFEPGVQSMLEFDAPVEMEWQGLAMFRPVANYRSRHLCVLLPFQALIGALEDANK